MAEIRWECSLALVPLSSEEMCCGFGGVFSVIYPEVSEALVSAKIKRSKRAAFEPWWRATRGV
jgi:Fe-S oxidoreductase